LIKDRGPAGLRKPDSLDCHLER